MAAFRDEFLSENDFETVLTTFWCYDYGVNASEAIEKITADQRDYHRCSLCVTARVYIGKKLDGV